MQFCQNVIAKKEAKETPIIEFDEVSFIHYTISEITVLATSKTNANAGVLLQFLYKLVDLCKAYFGGKFDENSIRKNFVLIYELLDEIMDYG